MAFKHYINESYLKHRFISKGIEISSETICGKEAGRFFKNSLTSDRSLVTCKRCLVQLKRADDVIMISSIKVFRDNEGIIIIECKGVTFSDIEDAVMNFRQNEEHLKTLHF